MLHLNKLGIHYMAMQRVSKDGLWSILSSDPDWIEYSAGHQFYQHDPSLVNPSHYDSGVSFMSAHQHEEFNNILQKHAELYFNLGNCLAIIEKTDQECWFTFLATDIKNRMIINTYISQFQYLKNFVRDFRETQKKALFDSFDHQVDLKIITPDSYYSNDNIANVSTESVTDDYSHINRNILDKLSAREKQVLKYFLLGKTAKETAALVDLSYRTIECYFTNIKRKLNIRYKRDLFSMCSTDPNA